MRNDRDNGGVNIRTNGPEVQIADSCIVTLNGMSDVVLQVTALLIKQHAG
ncbi:MAG: hypothetical protein ACJAS0_002365, partial [Alcanivorax borkumensis]